ncbi:hypothetical protein WKU36_00010 [Blautia sp. ICN-22010]|uniref:hypothetical protein n=1 Tax=Blautia sp. ICN-22010 TaxID=3134653 RepID=UPI0030BBAD67
MTKKKMTFLAVTAVAVIGISGGAVYAYNYQQEQTRQEQVKIEQEKKEAAEKAERERAAEAKAEIEKQLDTIEQNMKALYANEDMKMPADGLTQDKIDAVQKELDAFKETYGADLDASKEQASRFESLEKEFQYIPAMFEIVGTYGSLYPEGQLAVPGDDANHLLTKMKTSLEALKTSKPDFYSQYMGKVDEAQNALAGQLAVRDAVFMIYDKETGAMVEGVTREQYQDVLEAVNGLPENVLKTELLGYLPTVEQTLTAQEEAERKAAQESQQRKQASGNGTGSQVSNSDGGTSSGYTEGETYSGNEDSWSGGSESYSSGGSEPSGESSTVGGAEEEIPPKDQIGYMGEEYQSWTGGTKIAEGDIKGGGTWELFTW